MKVKTTHTHNAHTHTHTNKHTHSHIYPDAVMTRNYILPVLIITLKA